MRSDFLDAREQIESLNKTFEEHTKAINDSYEMLKKLNAEYKNLPSSYIQNQKEILDLLEKLRQAERNLANSVSGLQNSRNQRTTEEIVNQRLLAQAAERQAIIQSRLASEYQRLNARKQEAARKLQDLILLGRRATQTQQEYDRELRNAQNEYNALRERIEQADRAIGRFSNNGRNINAVASGVRDLMGAFGVVGGLSAFAAITKDVFTTTMQLQAMDNALKIVTKSEDNLAESQLFLSKVADDYGIDINVLTKQYTKFLAASENAITQGKISVTQIQDIFRSVSKVSGALGLSAEQQEGAYRALEQMLSKGNIQAEEIRGQLAERLPGAFSILAKAMNVTEAQLNKLLKDGKVLAADVLPAFAAELERAYGVENIERVQTLVAETSRLGNEWSNLIREITEGDSMVTKFFVSMVSGARKTLELLGRLTKSTAELQKNEVDKYQGLGYDKQSQELNAIAAKNKEQAEQEALIVMEAQKKQRDALKAEQTDLLEQLRFLQGYIKERQNSIAGKLFGVPSKMIAQEKNLKKEIQEFNKRIAYTIGSYNAAYDFLNKENTNVPDYGTGNNKKQKAEIDYLKDVYELRKLNTEFAISESKRIMDDERMNYADRLRAAEDYFFQQEKLLELNHEEQLRLNDLNYKTQVENYSQAISEGKSNTTQLNMLQYQHIIRKQKIDTEYEQKKSDLAIENAKKLYMTLEQIRLQAAENELSKESIADERQKSLLLSNVDKNTTLKQFAELENKLRKLADADTERKIQTLRNNQSIIREEKQKVEQSIKELSYKQKTASTEEERASISGELVKDSETYNKLTKKELDLEKEITTEQNKQKEAFKEIAKSIKDSTRQYLQSISDGTLGDFGMSGLSQFFDTVTYEVINDAGEIETRVGSTFDRMMDQATTFGEQFAIAFKGIGDIAKQAFSLMNQFSQAYFDAQRDRLEEDYRLAQKYAGDSDEAQKKATEDYQNRQRELRRQEAEKQKDAALFSAYINIAQGVTAALAKGPAGIPLAVVIGALGAVQIAAIKAQSVPAYAEGTDNHVGGAMLVNDAKGSNYREVVQTPDGSIYKPQGRNILMDAPKGTKVYKNYMDFESAQRELNSILSINDIAPLGAMTEGNLNINVDGKESISAAQMEAIMSNVVKNLSGQQTPFISIDRSGFHAHLSEHNARTENLNNRVQFNRRKGNGTN